MTKAVSWHKSVGFKLTGVTAALLALALVLVLSNFYTLSSIQGDTASLAVFAKGRMYLYQVLYTAHKTAAARFIRCSINNRPLILEVSDAQFLSICLAFEHQLT